MSAEPECFVPSTCDEHGNTYYPYVFKGVLDEAGTTIAVLEPAEFAQRHPTVGTTKVARTDDMNPRRLTHAEVMGFARTRRPCVFDELKGVGGPPAPGR